VRERKRELVGRVVSDRMEKTVVVVVQSLRRHRLYQRTMRRTKKYMAHNEGNDAKLGDLVRITESRPISRHKHWRVTTVLERAAERGKAVLLPELARTAAAPTVDLPPVATTAEPEAPEADEAPETTETAGAAAAPETGEDEAAGGTSRTSRS
jgi:small subunit ribosomal protein S17